MCKCKCMYVSMYIYILLLVFSPWASLAEPEPSQATGMALVRCILGKFLGVVAIVFPHIYIYIYIYSAHTTKITQYASITKASLSMLCREITVAYFKNRREHIRILYGYNPKFQVLNLVVHTISTRF
jgi:hypothetical protein